MLQAQIMFFATAGTISAPYLPGTEERPEFWNFDPDELAARWSATVRGIEKALQELEELRLIVRRYPDRKHHRGGIKPLLDENYLNMPDAEPKKCRPREAAIRAPKPERKLGSVVESDPIILGGELQFAPMSSPDPISSSLGANSSSPGASAYKEEEQEQTSSSQTTLESGDGSELVESAAPVELDILLRRKRAAMCNAAQGVAEGVEWANAYLARLHEDHVQFWRPKHCVPTFNQTVRALAGIAVRALPGIGEEFLRWITPKQFRLARGVGIVNSWADEFGTLIAPRPEEKNKPEREVAYGSYEQYRASGGTLSCDEWIKDQLRE
jgi:hypothetical protein